MNYGIIIWQRRGFWTTARSELDNKHNPERTGNQNKQTNKKSGIFLASFLKEELQINTTIPWIPVENLAQNIHLLKRKLKLKI